MPNVELVHDFEEPEEEDLGRVADGVVRIWSQSVLTAVDASGQLILERLFRGDAELFRSRGPKAESLPQLADALADRGMKFSAGKLRRMIHQHLMIQELVGGRSVSSLAHLSPSHFDEVASLGRPARTRLLLHAEEQRLTVAQLRECADAAKGKTPSPPRRRTRARVPATLDADHAHAVLTRLEECAERLRTIANDLPPGLRQNHAVRVRAVGVSMRLRELGERIADGLRPEE